MKLLITFISMMMLFYSREASLNHRTVLEDKAGIIYVIDTSYQPILIFNELTKEETQIEKVNFEIINDTEDYPKKVLLSQYFPPSEHASRTRMFKEQLNDFLLIPMDYWLNTNYTKLVGEFEDANSIYVVFSEDMDQDVVAVYKVLVEIPDPLLVETNDVLDY